MSPRVIHIPLSGGDRKALAKGLRNARGLHDFYMTQSLLARDIGEAKIREADVLECQAWNAIMWTGGPAMPSPTIGRALNAGHDLLEVKCNRCGRVSLVALRAIDRPPDTEVHVLEAALFCDPCSGGRKWKQRAHIVGLTFVRPEPEHPRSAISKSRSG